MLERTKRLSGKPKELYKKFNDVHAAIRDLSPDLPELVGTVNQFRNESDFDPDWRSLFFSDLTGVFIEEERFDTALFTARFVNDVRYVATDLIDMAGKGNKQALLYADDRFVAERVYSRTHRYDSDMGGEYQKTPELFETAIDQGWLREAGLIFGNVRNVDQLESMIRKAMPFLISKSHIVIPNFEDPADAQAFCDEALKYVVNGFTTATIFTSETDSTLELPWALQNDPRDPYRQDRIRRSVLFGLGINLAYMGRVEEVENIRSGSEMLGLSSTHKELGRFASLGYFIKGDIDTALEKYKEIMTNQPYHRSWLTRSAIVALAKNGKIAESVLMASRIYDPTEESPGRHKGYLLALAVAAAHGVYES